MKRIALFLIAGGSGFLVDAGVLWLMLNLTPAGPYLGRAVAILVAMGFTWFFNRTFTFGRSTRSIAAEGLRYGTVGVLTALNNYGLYAALLFTIPMLQPFAALVFASIGAMGLSFFGYSRYVFQPR